MDVAILGMGLPSVYVASRLAEKGISVGLFGKLPPLIPEPVKNSTIKDFKLFEAVLNKLKTIAHFSKDFELKERRFSGATIDTELIYSNYLNKAIDNGCELIEGSFFGVSDKIKIFWRGKTTLMKAEIIIEEERTGRPIQVALAKRVPINEDTVEVYDSSGTWVVPAKNMAVIGGKMDFTWNKFDSAAILRSFELTYVNSPGSLIEKNIKLGRAGGQTTSEGFVINSLYDARVLADILLKKGNLKAYDKMSKRTHLRSFLRP